MDASASPAGAAGGRWCVRHAAVRDGDRERAVEELVRQLSGPDLTLVLIFCSTSFDLDWIAPALRSRFPGVEIAGCTTTRELSPAGYASNSIVGISLAAPDFFAVTRRIEDLPRFGIERGQALVSEAMDELSRRSAAVDPGLRRFAMLMIDGVSRCEEAVVSSLQSVLGNVPLVGGSAGDDLAFERTWVLHGGRFHDRGAVLIIVATNHPFEVFKTEHFVASDRRLVVTGADPARRMITDINGRPAAVEYARLTGNRVKDLTPEVFAANPVLVRSGGGNFVRSIQQANPDGSLTFMCAIDEGLVLRMGENIGIIEDLERRLGELRARLGPLQIVIGCECILRYLELEQKQLIERAGEVLRRHTVVGFCTYGEQYQSMHINQTFTGVAIGRIGTGGYALP